jgi:outer membrane protein OmpA-like peptidoglycan-associated protein
MGGKYAGTDIWVSKKDENGNWLPASNAGSPWNNKQSNSVIGINHDHTIVYLLNAYSNKSGIAFSKLFSGAWGEPEFIPIPGINRDDFVGFYVSPTFDVILISMKGKDSFGEEDLYVSLKDSFGKWTEPKNLGPTINTKGFEISPFLSQDKKRLFFSSNGHPGFGDADIFEADRLYESWTVWSKPQNLGNDINSSSFDGYFSAQDSIGYFSSSYNERSANVYKVSFKVKVDTLDQKVKEIVSEAQSILIDLNRLADDMATRKVVSRIYYPQKSIELDSQGYIQLTKAIEDCKKLGIKEISLVAFSKEFDTNQLNKTISEKRLNKIIDSYRTSLGLDVKINSEISLNSTFDKKACVEIRYSIK